MMSSGVTPSAPGLRLDAGDEEHSAAVGLGSLAALGEIGDLHSYSRGEALLRQGERTRRFVVLVRGRLKACLHTPDGRSLILGLYEVGDVLGFAETLAGLVLRATIVAMEESSCLLVRREPLFDYLARHPQSTRQLLPALVRGLVSCVRCPAETIHKSVERRFAQLFLDLSQASGRCERSGVWIPLALSRRELSELTGTTIETCSRIMSRWRRHRVVLTSDDGFVVRDRDALERLARHRAL